jgi:hypothetical protein
METNRCAALHGPRVCELEGPTPILKISNTEMASYGKLYKLSVKNNYRLLKYIMQLQ